jgi:hypothetical protein
MKHVKLFFQTRADQCIGHACGVGTTIQPSDPATAEGMRAFAVEQAWQFQEMQANCEHVWQYVAAFVSLGQGDIVPLEVQAGGNDELDIE